MTKGLYLTLLAGPIVPVPIPRVVIDALTSVQVTVGAGEASGFQLTFNLSTRSPLHTLFLVTAGQTPLLRVILAVTIGGTADVLMDGVVTNHQVSPGNDPGIAQLTLTGTDLTTLMELLDLIPTDGFPFPAMPPEARVGLILLKYAFLGIIPIVIPSIPFEVPDPTDRIPKQEGTDLEYIRELADDAGYVFYLDPGPVVGTNRAYWGPEIKVGIPQPALSLDMDAHRNVESMQFSFDNTSTTLPIMVIHEPHTKLPIPILVPSFNPLQPPLGLVPPLPRRIEKVANAAKLSPIEALRRVFSITTSTGDAVSASGSLDVTRYGRLLKPRGLVGVRGAGLAYDGLYFVKSVTTTMKRGECKQSFKLARNALVSNVPTLPV